MGGHDVPDNVICEDGVCRVVSPAEAAAHRQADARAGTEAEGTPAVLTKLLGSVLQGHNGEVATAHVTSAGKVIGLYSSAHWCGPCRAFTPELAKWYTNFKTKSPRKDDFEIVFVSLDRDESSFDDYFATMPWLALPYKERGLKDVLCRKFKVNGIPSLIIIDAATGEVINGSGDDAIQGDPEGDNFPWRPKAFSELLGDTLVDGAGKRHAKQEALAGKVKLVYFSAHWCPPCRGFTPELVKTYEALKAAGKNVEAVFVSSDRDETGFKDYLSHMPWLALPFEARDAKAALSQLYGVNGIPTLVVLDEDDKVITTNGRSAVASDPEGVDFPWTPKPLDCLNEGTVGAVNEATVLLLLLDPSVGKDAAQAKAEEILLQLAKSEQQAKGDVTFLWALRDAFMPAKIIAFLGDRASMKLGEGDELVLLNLPEQSVYRWAAKEPHAPTAADAAAFLKEFKAGSLEAHTLR